jgi:hypothetical protein
MRKTIGAILVLISVALALVALIPQELVAEKTVGHQARADRLRRVEAKPRNDEPRICAEGQVSTDRDPCVGANGRLDFSR